MNKPLWKIELAKYLRGMIVVEQSDPDGTPANVTMLEEFASRLEEELGIQCRCGKPGTKRTDGGLSAGVHCDECWRELVADCRKQSW